MYHRKRISSITAIARGLYLGAAAGFLFSLFILYSPTFTLNVTTYFREFFFYILRNFLPPHSVWRLNNPAGTAIVFTVIGAAGWAFSGLSLILFGKIFEKTRTIRHLTSLCLGFFVFVLAAVLSVMKFRIHDLENVRYLLISLGTGGTCGFLAGWVHWRISSFIRHSLDSLSPIARYIVICIPPLLFLLFLVIQTSRGITVTDIEDNGGEINVTGRKVVLIGLDGTEWSVMNPLLEQGRLPHFRKLIDSGSRGYLRTFKPMKSPVIWTTIASGVGSHYHGISHFITKGSDDSRPQLMTSDKIEVELLWETASRYDLTSGIMGWYVSWPAQPLNGYLISDLSRYDSIERRTYPDTLEDMIDDFNRLYSENRIDYLSRFLDFPEGWEWNDENMQKLNPRESFYLKILDKAFHQDFIVHSAIKRLLRDEQPDLLGVYFVGADRIQHKLYKYYWKKYRSDRFSNLLFDVPENSLEFSDVIHRYYIFLDEALGNIMSSVDMENTDFIVVSDHGFSPIKEKTNFDLNTILNQLGFLHFRQDGHEIDESATTAFGYGTMPWEKKKYISLNPSDKNDRSRYDLLKKRVVKVLQQLETVEGTPLFREITDLEKENPNDRNLPDLRVTFNEDLPGKEYSFNESVFPTSHFINRTISDSGYHSINAMIILSGRSFENHARIRHASVIDIAPTVSYLLGIPVSSDFEGWVIEEVLAESFKNRYNLITENRNAVIDRERAVLGEEVENSIKEQLRALGYIQ